MNIIKPGFQCAVPMIPFICDRTIILFGRIINLCTFRLLLKGKMARHMLAFNYTVFHANKLNPKQSKVGWSQL